MCDVVERRGPAFLAVLPPPCVAWPRPCLLTLWHGPCLPQLLQPVVSAMGVVRGGSKVPLGATASVAHDQAPSGPSLAPSMHDTTGCSRHVAAPA